MPEWIANGLQQALDFSNTLNVSITASWLILAVILLRFLLKKAPKWIRVALWGLVAVRLVLPISIESSYSLVPSTETIPREILTSERIQLQEPAYLEVISNPAYAKDITVELDQTVDRVQIRVLDMTFMWLVGMVAMLLYTVISYLRLYHKISTAVFLKDNIFQSEYVSSPFVLGVLRPRIYMPFCLDEHEMEYVVAHEQTHIRRKDHWWKLLGFLLLTIHWFNPLMWLAYILLCRDIELACDEKVIKELDNAQRADYSQALVSCSINRRVIAACPLAFGEVGVKERVKSVMNYKKPAFWIILLAVLVGIALAVCFLTNPKQATVYDILGQNGYAKKGYEQEASWQILNHSVEMLPTSAKMTGAFDGYLYLPMKGENYRYERTDVYVEIMPKDQLLYSFTENADPEDVEWNVYSIKEYPDLAAIWVEAGEDYKCVYQYSPSKRSELDALSQAVEEGRVVHMDGYVENGKDTWQEFVEATTAGKVATVKLASYYTLDQKGCSEQYYEAHKEDYPVLYRKELTYDGSCYTLRWTEGNKEYVREYQYLMNYTVEAPAAKKASYDTVIRYVLTNDDKVSWEELQWGLYSSQWGAYIDHYTVYTELQ